MINREIYMNRIKSLIGSDKVKILSGIRRIGKTTMLNAIVEELQSRGVTASQFISINLEEMKNAHIVTSQQLLIELNSRLAGINGRAYIILDEVQAVDDWRKCVESLREKHNCEIYIASSSIKEPDQYTPDMYAVIPIYPFSYTEFAEVYHQAYPDTPENELFIKYLLFGGMPYLVNLGYKEEPGTQYLQDMFGSAILKDIVKQNKVRDVRLLEKIIAYIFSNPGSTFSASSISKYFREENLIVAPETIINYIKYCQEAFLFHRSQRQDLQANKLLSTNEKYYVADHGIRGAVYGSDMRDIDLLLENILFIEMLRRGYKVTVGKIGDNEIDFICTNERGKIYVQAAYLLSTKNIIARKFDAYDLVKDHYPKYVVSMDETDMSRNGIKHRNIRKFVTTEFWE